MTDIDKTAKPSSSNEYDKYTVNVDGCEVKLYFPKRSEMKILEEVKHIILSGAIKA